MNQTPESEGSQPEEPPIGVPVPPAGFVLPPPGYTTWAGPPRPNRRRRGVGVGVAAVLLVGTTAASAGISHVVWPSRTSTVSAAAGSPSVSSPAPTSGSGSGSGSSDPYSGGSSPFAGGFSFGSNSDGGQSASGSTSTGSGGPSDVSAIAAKVSPALVDINTTFGYQEASGAGTGIVLTSNGEILTNNHVIDGATKISVTDIGNGRIYSATVVGYDSSDDVAVLQLQGASGLSTARLADSSKLKVGDPVVAVGNAGGTGGTPSASGGSVVALDQAITASDSLDGSSEQLSNLIEVNADVQAGDSGGSLVDANGEVVGMDSAAAEGYSLQSSSSEGYAIPIDTAISIAKQIESGESSAKVHVGSTAFLGLLLSSGAQYQADSGVDVGGVVAGGAAASAGIAAGDVITQVGGQTVASQSDLSAIVAKLHPGDRVSVTWTDTSGQTHTASVLLASGPPA